ncbi:MAG: BACON domain-containing carbohydrate-binding protein [Bacteroidales bacterium]|nr:BACON domain-containing carbohydrate-binding protein [Bacteroidales bacterium]
MKNFFTRTLFVLSAFIMLFACTQSNEQKGDPKVTVSPMSIDASAGDFELNYTGENLNGKTLAVESSEDWLTAAVENEKIKFHVDANFGDARMAKITILIDGNAVAEATISQKTYESDYFNVSVDKITSYGCTAKISTKGTYKGNYYFIILGKSTVDNFLSLETGNYGDVNFLDALYQNEYSWLQGYARDCREMLIFA